MDKGEAVKLIRGLTWRFNPRLKPQNAAEYKELTQSDEAWVVVSHNGVEQMRAPLTQFEIEPNYQKLMKAFPVAEVRVNAPVWVEWALDLVDGS